LEDKFIEKIEWRIFLISLRQRYEYFQAFKIIDKSGDGTLDQQEFVDAKDLLEQWVGPMENPKATF